MLNAENRNEIKLSCNVFCFRLSYKKYALKSSDILFVILTSFVRLKIRLEKNEGKRGV